MGRRTPAAYLGVRPAQGRLYGDGETAASGQRRRQIVLVSHELWQTAFGGQPLIGRTIEVNGRMRQVVGIMAPGADVVDNRTRSGCRSHFAPTIGRTTAATISMSSAG